MVDAAELTDAIQTSLDASSVTDARRAAAVDLQRVYEDALAELVVAGIAAADKRQRVLDLLGCSDSDYLEFLATSAMALHDSSAARICQELLTAVESGALKVRIGGDPDKEWRFCEMKVGKEQNA